MCPEILLERGDQQGRESEASLCPCQAKASRFAETQSSFQKGQIKLSGPFFPTLIYPQFSVVVVFLDIAPLSKLRFPADFPLIKSQTRRLCPCLQQVPDLLSWQREHRSAEQSSGPAARRDAPRSGRSPGAWPSPRAAACIPKDPRDVHPPRDEGHLLPGSQGADPGLPSCCGMSQQRHRCQDSVGSSRAGFTFESLANK